MLAGHRSNQENTLLYGFSISGFRVKHVAVTQHLMLSPFTAQLNVFTDKYVELLEPRLMFASYTSGSIGDVRNCIPNPPYSVDKALLNRPTWQSCPYLSVMFY